MSVVVIGMEMPESCMDCKIKQYDDYEDDCVCPFSGVVCLSVGRQDACPLGELPDKHGRLVDADALIADIRKNSASYFADDFAHEWVDRQPIIVEAEDET